MPAPPPSLTDLRREIDRIDAGLHALLIERGEIIGTLIKVKNLETSGAREAGSAFRPGREASMMRTLVGRHRGLLPVTIVEAVWRTIIATFTHVQAPYTVHADTSLGMGPMQDVTRFHFGFVVPWSPQPGAADAVRAVAASRGDLALVPVGAAGAWWRALEAEGAPKVIARLPFVDRAGHPASLPTYVVSRPVDEAAAAADRRLVSATLPEGTTLPDGVSVVAHVGEDALLELDDRAPLDALAAALPAAPVPVGSHAAPFPHPAD